MTESDVVASFGLVVQRARKAVGLSQEGLAALAALDRTYVSGLERGRRNPTLVTQARVAAALGRPLSELFAEMETL